jgi:hypothetical protein
MRKYIMTFESYSKRKKKRKIWDELLKIKPRLFRSVNIEPEVQIKNPDMTIPSLIEGG